MNFFVAIIDLNPKNTSGFILNHRHFLTEAEIYGFVANFITPGRADNNIIPLTEADAVEIFRKSATRMLKI